MERLIARLREIVGASAGATPHEHQLRTYESDGLLQYSVAAGGRGAARAAPSRCRRA